jgi:hypothetical protein
LSPLKTKHKVAIWVAVIGAIALVLASLVPGLIPRILVGSSKKYISGTVSDAVARAPMLGVVVQLQTNEGTLLTQDTTDRDGKFNLTIPDGLSAIRLTAAADGYVPYDEKLPAQDTKNDIRLERQPISFGIPDGTQLNKALRILAGKLNVTIVFSRACNNRATTAALNGREIHGDPKVPDAILKDLVTQVKDNSLRYDVNTIETGRRYEISCY